MSREEHPLRRADPRSLVTPLEIKGIVTNVRTKEHEPLLVWNISDGGACIWVTNKFSTGDQLSLTIAKPWVVTLGCEVRWCREFEGRSGYLVGVRVLDNLSRLEALHRHLANTIAQDLAAASG